MPVTQSHRGAIYSLFGCAAVQSWARFLFLYNTSALMQNCCHSVENRNFQSFGTEILGNASLYFATVSLSACLKVLWNEATDGEILPPKNKGESRIYLLVNL